jgi:hypothetical protein
MTKQDIARLRAQAQAEFHAAEAKFKQQIDALAIVEGMLSMNRVDVSLSAIEKQLNPTPKEPLMSIAQQPTVIDAVRETVLSSPQHKWPVSEIESSLRHRDFVFMAKDPKSTINNALSRLVEQGTVRVAVRGKGRKPSFYKASDRGEAQSENPNEAQEVKNAAA